VSFKARVGWVRMNKHLKCTSSYGTYGIPKLSSFMCHRVGQYPTSLWMLYGTVSSHHGVSAEAYAWKTALGWGRTRPDSLTTSWTVTTCDALQACLCHVVRFIPLQGWLLIRISTTPSNMGDGLFAAPKHSNSTFKMLLGSWDGYRQLGSRRDD
jgi:hypothetical protein